MTAFDRHTQQASFHSPLEEFAEVDIDVEVREDPLTDRQARIVPESFLTPEETDIEEIVSDDEGCFFCPENVTDLTPTYPDWMDTERGEVGEATSFPNLNPYGAHSNVVALTKDHYRPIDEFTPEIFEDGLQAALEFVTAVRDHEDAPLTSVNMNFLRPAGSSIIHPHLQTLVGDRGTNVQRTLLEASRTHHDEYSESYWETLVEDERDGERHVGTTGSVEWLAPFAPRHHRHFMGIASETGVPTPDGEVASGFAAGITNVLDYYGDSELNSFNFALWLADDPAMPPVLDIVARSVFGQYYWSDSPFFTVLHDEGVVDISPETYAEEASEHF